MRTPTALAIAAISSLTLLSSAAPAREFEDKFGRIIEAELVSHTGAAAENVTINKGGKEFEVKVSIFSEKDQQFIRDWMKANPPKLNYAFRVEAEKKKLTSSSSSSSYSRSKSQVYVYEVKVTNLTRQPVSDITIEYLAFMKTSSSSTNSKGDTITVKGPMRYNQTATFTTKPFTLDSYRYSYYYSSSYSYKDSLLGVLVRVKDPQGNVIEDYRTTGTGFKATWPASRSGGVTKPEVVLD